MKTIIYGGDIYLEGREILNGYIIIENNHIIEINGLLNKSPRLEEIANSGNFDQIINATGKIVAPGSIEMHTHGFAGKEFVNITPKDLEDILKAYAKSGVTSVSPTIVTDTIDNIKATLETIGKSQEEYETSKKRGAKPDRANLLSCYLECRYFKDSSKRGAHKSEELVNDAKKYREKYNLVNDSRDLTEIILDEIVKEFAPASRSFVNVISIDPALEGASETIKILKTKGYNIAIGHSDCTIEQAREAIENGASILIHAYNCISMDRDYVGDRPTNNPNTKNCLGECLDSEETYAEIVADFVHVKKCYVSMLKNRKEIEHIILITDASALAGSEEKECTLGGRKVIVKEVNGHKAAYYEDDTLCGSVLTMNQAIKNVVEAGYTLNEAFRMASLNPAKAMGIDSKRGSISENKLADIVIYEKFPEIDKKTQIKKYDTIGRTLCTLVEGNIIYYSEDFH